MLSLYRTLSLRYLSRRWFRALLIVASLMLGVATLVATQALSETMSKAALASGNPLAGKVDLIVTNGEFPIDSDLVAEINRVAGVKQAHPRLFGQGKLVIGDKRYPVLIMGIELTGEKKDATEFEEHFELDPMVKTVLENSKNMEPMPDSKEPVDLNEVKAKFFNSAMLGCIPVITGTELESVVQDAPTHALLQLKLLHLEKKQIDKDATAKSSPSYSLVRVATVKPSQDADLAALCGHVIIMGLANASEVLGIPKGQVRRIDVTLDPGVNPKTARKDIKAILRKRAEVRTIAEHNQTLQSATKGMQTGFSMCGVAALIVGMFLVYNSLAIGVAERRHEIGLLLALGATRDQVWRLFAGEAVVLGCIGSALGIPLGLGLAHLGLQPMQDAISDIFSALNFRQVELSRELTILAFVVGIMSSLVASLIPAIQAAYDKPADAVRKVPKEPAVSHLILHIAATVILILGGIGLILLREHLPTDRWQDLDDGDSIELTGFDQLRQYLPSKRWGTYGGLGLVMVGTLLAAPLCAHLAARALSPLARRFFPIEWRLAADNLVRAPGRTGLVIGALAAGVCLVVETAGIIRSNRIAIHDWVDSSIAADLIVTSGNPVGSGGQTALMEEVVGNELRELPEVEDALPIRLSNEVLFRDVRISLMTTVADRAYLIEKKRLSKPHEIELLKMMTDQQDHPDGDPVIISENFAALHHIRRGGTITLNSPNGEVKLRVIGTVVDYSWNLGTIMMNRRDYLKYWPDTRATVFDVYLKPGYDPNIVKKKIDEKLGAKYDLHPLTRLELKSRIDEMIERLYGIAFGQQIVVMLVAALGVVTALLISVLQRRREMGLLRAIGASQAQVVYLVLTEAFLMGIFGTILGLIFSVPLQWYALQVVFLEESGYTFPVHIAWGMAGFVALMAMLIATLAGLGPALYAVRQRIPEAIAYE